MTADEQHERVRKDIEEGYAGPCKACGIYIATEQSGHLCSDCSKP